MSKKHLLYLIILIVIVANINFIYSFRYYQEDRELSSDQELYWRIGMSILEAENYYLWGENEKKDIGIQVAPAYSAIIAGLCKVFGVNKLPIYIFQVILNIICIVILFEILSFFLKYSFAFIVLLLFELYYPLWKMNFSIMVEILTVTLLSASLYFLQRALQSNRNLLVVKRFSGFFFLFGLLIFVNNRFIFHFAFIILFLIICSFKNRSLIKITLRGIIIVSLVLSPWFIRQYIHYDQFVLFTPTWNNFSYKTLGFPAKVPIISDVDNASSEDIKPWSYAEYIESFKKTRGEDNNYEDEFTIELYEAIIAKNDPDSKIKLYLSEFRLFWTPFILNYRFVNTTDVRIMMPSTKPQLIVGVFFLLPVMVFSIVGVFLSIIKKNPFMVLLSILLCSHILLHLLTQFIPRYRLTILPVMFILACYSISVVLPSLGKKRK